MAGTRGTTPPPSRVRWQVVRSLVAPGTARSRPLRVDYAEAAVAALTSDGHDGKTYEPAGDEAYSLSDLGSGDLPANGEDDSLQELA